MNCFQIAGYDKRTELLAVNHDLPENRASEIRLLARMSAEDDGLGCYPINASAVRQIGSWLGWPLQVDLYDWFVEPADDEK